MWSELEQEQAAAPPRSNRSILVCAFNKRIADELQWKLQQPAPALNWSEQQLAIFDWMERGKGNLVVVARAGTSKTTTIIEAVRRINGQAQARTLHSVGYSCARPYIGNAPVQNHIRAKRLAEQVCGNVPGPMITLVKKLHTIGREVAPHAMKLGDLTDLLYRFDCEPDDEWENQGYDAEWVEMKALEAMEIAATVKPTEIDFADMVYLPVRNHWLRPMWDDVLVDEAQDMNPAQLEIALGVCKSTADGGRIAVVGDNRQAMYGFRGADSNSIDRLKAALHAKELKLTDTYRCGRLITAEAAKLVPDFGCKTDFDGVIRTIIAEQLNEQIGYGDFLLSRLNAPLVSVAMSLIREQKRTRIAGRDIGTGLRNLVTRMSNLAKDRTVGAMLARLHQWVMAEAEKLLSMDREDDIDVLYDKEATIRALSEDAASVDKVISSIDALFTDDGLGAGSVITCSSVHRAKGLEADRVFILKDTLERATSERKDDKGKRRNMEEENIKYVAITRARRELVWVVG